MADESAVVAREASAAGSYYDGMLDNLVTQFSSALDCFRELVQNSIDAGSPRVEVWTEYLPGEGHEGTIAIHIDDFGEGMDEAIIDNQFTQLFASTKDDDLTKIGKFGIGFVSVFALKPRAVLVHTGRAGEYWEVLFHEDRTFSKTRVDNPVEGTQMTLFLAGEYSRYQELAEEIPATLRHWCNHSEVEVTFEDRTNNTDFSPPRVINEAFEVSGECLQRVEYQGTEMVLAYHGRPIYGFYNRGLTLALSDVAENVLDGWAPRFEFVSFKIKSRYLEHTLSRDSVVRDEQYQKAMGLLEEAANGPLLTALVEEVEALAGASVLQVDEVHRYGHLMGFLSREPVSALREHERRKILRCVNGEAISLRDAWEQIREEGRLLIDDGETELSRMLVAEGMPVVLNTGRSVWSAAGGQRAVERLVRRVVSVMAHTSLKGRYWRALHFVKSTIADDEHGAIPARIQRALVTPASVYVPVAIESKPTKEKSALLEAAHKVLREARSGSGLFQGNVTSVRKLTLGTIQTKGANSPLFVMGKKVSLLMARPPESISEESLRKMEVVVNQAHPQFEMILHVHRRDPAMGAYMLAKNLLLIHDVALQEDAALMSVARNLK